LTQPTGEAGPVRPRLLLLLLAPALALFALLTLYPLARVVLLSFTATDHGFADARFVGLDNFVELWEGRGFRRAAWNTVVFALMATIAEVLLGLALALLLDWSCWRPMCCPRSWWARSGAPGSTTISAS
jgi:ABC-type sugar transport system permease subunit